MDTAASLQRLLSSSITLDLSSSGLSKLAPGSLSARRTHHGTVQKPRSRPPNLLDASRALTVHTGGISAALTNQTSFATGSRSAASVSAASHSAPTVFTAPPRSVSPSDLPGFLASDHMSQNDQSPRRHVAAAPMLKAPSNLSRTATADPLLPSAAPRIPANPQPNRSPYIHP